MIPTCVILMSWLNDNDAFSSSEMARGLRLMF